MLHTADTAFSAIASPARRQLLDLLKAGELTVGALTDELHISQPAVSQHLASLREAGLVDERRDGRFRYYRLTAQPLAEVLGWVQAYEQFWNARLDALGRALDTMDEKGPKPHGRKHHR